MCRIVLPRFGCSSKQFFRPSTLAVPASVFVVDLARLSSRPRLKFSTMTSWSYWLRAPKTCLCRVTAGSRDVNRVGLPMWTSARPWA
eukprot:11752994-Alexandrium_andersonii.AAC.2